MSDTLYDTVFKSLKENIESVVPARDAISNFIRYFPTF